MLDERIARVKALIAQRETIDEELRQILGLEERQRKPQVCGKCGEPGHTARTCTKEVAQP